MIFSYFGRLLFGGKKRQPSILYAEGHKVTIPSLTRVSSMSKDRVTVSNEVIRVLSIEDYLRVVVLDEKVRISSVKQDERIIEVED